MLYVVSVALDSEHGNWHAVDHHLLVVESVILTKSKENAGATPLWLDQHEAVDAIDVPPILVLSMHAHELSYLFFQLASAWLPVGRPGMHQIKYLAYGYDCWQVVGKASIQDGNN